MGYHFSLIHNFVTTMALSNYFLHSYRHFVMTSVMQFIFTQKVLVSLSCNKKKIMDISTPCRVNSATSSLKKLVCFTRSSAVLHSIPSTYPASTSLDENSRKLIEHFIWPTEEEVIICKLSSLMTQQMVTDLLMEFMEIKTI